MADTTPVLSVRSFSVLSKSGIECVRTVWLTGDFFGIISYKKFSYYENLLKYFSFSFFGSMVKILLKFILELQISFGERILIRF